MSEIHEAAIAGDIAGMRRLLDRGADIESRDHDEGHTPLMAACLSLAAGPDTLAFLLDRGADLHARHRPPTIDQSHIDELLDNTDLEPELRAALEKSREILRTPPEENALIALAVTHGDCAKLRLLIDRGADVRHVSSHGYTLLTLAACANRMDVFDLLVAAGAPLDGESSYRESALSRLSDNGRFDQIRRLLDLGADPAPLAWTPLHRAVAIGSLEEVEELLERSADMETPDRWGRSAFLLAIHAGDPDKASLLLSRGAKRHATGHCRKQAMSYPLARDDTRMLQWLLDQGFDPDAADEFGHTPLMNAAECGAPGCFRLLTDAGADWSLTDHCDEGLLPKASHPEIIAMLQDRGEDLSKLETDVLRKFIGLGTAGLLDATRQDYLRGSSRRFGNANPERMNVPFWNAMVRCGWSAYQAANRFGDDSFDRGEPVWCHSRFGMSLTCLPDGRFVQIAGEHEDSYDPDFCIYNDVIIHDGKGGFEILGYPQEVFPPTDFHSATLVGPWIYIIGNLGYPWTREAFAHETPVYRFHTGTGSIERVSTKGKSPGWIHRHRADPVDGNIRISGGRILTMKDNGESDITDHQASYLLHLETLTWHPDP
jgi:ankyrin repeat protein